MHGQHGGFSVSVARGLWRVRASAGWPRGRGDDQRRRGETLGRATRRVASRGGSGVVVGVVEEEEEEKEEGGCRRAEDRPPPRSTRAVASVAWQLGSEGGSVQARG